jgi:hypothetical protein
MHQTAGERKTAQESQKRAPAPVTIRRQRAQLRRADGLGYPFSKFSLVCVKAAPHRSQK